MYACVHQRQDACACTRHVRPTLYTCHTAVCVDGAGGFSHHRQRQHDVCHLEPLMSCTYIHVEITLLSITIKPSRYGNVIMHGCRFAHNLSRTGSHIVVGGAHNSRATIRAPQQQHCSLCIFVEFHTGIRHACSSLIIIISSS